MRGGGDCGAEREGTSPSIPTDAGPTRRSLGVQLHLTSLPGGRLGPAAFEFVDWLAEAGAAWWQTLPLGPPDRYGSPYKSASAFAAWRGFLAEPDAPVEADELAAFAEPRRFWLESLPRRLWADQVRFDREWAALRAHARQRGVRLIGDVPIYVAPGSYDQKAWPELFLQGAVAGAPPDTFSDKGQHWGNPLYDWSALRRGGYRWWTERFRRTFELFDLVRIDHFRGFVSYWAVPEDAPDASHGRWRRGPGKAVFDAAAGELSPSGPLPCIAEDLGVITEPVTALRRALGFPGMVVAQFAFDPDDPRGPHRPENHGDDVVAYTGTHDTDTLAGWLGSLPAERRREVDGALREAGLAGDDADWGVMRLWARSPAPLLMVQAQDVLGLGSEARMNMPGTTRGSWRWQLEPGALTPEHAARLRAVAEESGRLAEPRRRGRGDRRRHLPEVPKLAADDRRSG